MIYAMHVKKQNAPARQVPSYPMCAFCFIRGGVGRKGGGRLFFFFDF